MDKRKEIIKYRFSNPQKAYDICCELLEQGIQSGNDYEIAYAYLYMGDTLFSMGKMDDALKYLVMSEKVQKQNGFDDLRMKTYNIIGIIYSNMGDALLSMDYYHSSLELAIQYNNYVLIAMLYNNVGSLLSYVGDSAKAAEYYKLSYEYFLKNDDSDKELSYSMIQLHMNICEGLRYEKRYAEATAYLFDTVGTIDQEKLSLIDKIRIAHVLAMIYYNTCEYEKSYDMCIKALELYKQDSKNVEVFDDYRDIAELLINMNKIEHVQGMIGELGDMAEKSGIDSRRIKVCKLRIQIYEKNGEKQKLVEQLCRYYQLKKKINEERNNIIISAIDNRCRLEDERKKNKQLNEDNMKLVKESEIDELTGIYNRLAFRRRYDRLYRYALRNNHAYCMGIFDIDYFKVYNDSYGHIKGDQCLKQVAQILRRTSDGDFCVARYGGDEFVFMAYDVSEDKVRDFLRRLVENIRNAAITFDKKPDTGTDSVTISIGAVIQNRATEGMELAELLKQADRVLYEVKQSGKDGYKLRIE